MDTSTVTSFFAQPEVNFSNIPSRNDSSTSSNVSEQEDSTDALQKLSQILSTEVSAVICIFGLLGNMLTLIILSKRVSQRNLQSMERGSHEGLIALSVSDMLFCLVTLPAALLHYRQNNRIHPKLYTAKDFHLLYTVYSDFIVNVFITSSTLLTLMMAVQRYLAICHPIKTRMRNNHKQSRILLLTTFLIAILLNLPRIWKRRIVAVKCMYRIIKANCSGIDMLYSSKMAYLQEEKAAKTAFMVIHFLLSVAIPLLILSFCNCKLIQGLKKSNQLRKRHSYISVTSGVNTNGVTCIDHSQRITLTLIIIIIMFLVLVVPAEITNFVRDFIPEIKTLQPLHINSFITALVNTLQKVNFAFNFILYCVVNQNFRKTLWDVMVGKAVQQFGTSTNTTCKLQRSSLRSDLKFHSMDFQMTLVKDGEEEFRRVDAGKQPHHQSIQNFMCNI